MVKEQTFGNHLKTITSGLSTRTTHLRLGRRVGTNTGMQRVVGSDVAREPVASVWSWRHGRVLSSGRRTNEWGKFRFEGKTRHLKRLARTGSLGSRGDRDLTPCSNCDLKRSLCASRFPSTLQSPVCPRTIGVSGRCLPLVRRDPVCRTERCSVEL